MDEGGGKECGVFCFVVFRQGPVSPNFHGAGEGVGECAPGDEGLSHDADQQKGRGYEASGSQGTLAGEGYKKEKEGGGNCIAGEWRSGVGCFLQEVLGGGTRQGEVGKQGAVAKEGDGAQSAGGGEADGIDAGDFFVRDLVVGEEGAFTIVGALRISFLEKPCFSSSCEAVGCESFQGEESGAVSASVSGVVQDAVFLRPEAEGCEQGINGGGMSEEVGVVGDDDQTASPGDPAPKASYLFVRPGAGGCDYPEFGVFVYRGEVGYVSTADDFFDQVVGVLRLDGQGMVVRLCDAPVAFLPVGDFVLPK